jgi:hypothetical protein
VERVERHSVVSEKRFIVGRSGVEGGWVDRVERHSVISEEDNDGQGEFPGDCGGDTREKAKAWLSSTARGFKDPKSN